MVSDRFHNFMIIQGISGNLLKSKLPPVSGSVVLSQLNPIHKKGPESFFFFCKLAKFYNLTTS